jgi:hypothetical protein
MKSEDRKKVDNIQINRFFLSYYTEWRHIQILSIQKLLHDKYNFYSEIIEQAKETDKQANESTITQEITNGLLFDAIQSNIQYIEDLFAFINACEKPEFFLRKIVKYKVGSVTNSIRNAKFSRKAILKQFHFPDYEDNLLEEEKQSDVMQKIISSTESLSKVFSETVEFYKKYDFFYNQYKHGLTVALRPYRNYTEDEIKLDKEGKFGPYPLVAIDNLNFKDAPKNQYGNLGYLLIPAFDEIIRINMQELQLEDNLLRFVMTPKGTNIDMLVNQASKTKRCIQLLIHNFLQIINEQEVQALRLPAENDGEVYEFRFKVQEK